MPRNTTFLSPGRLAPFARDHSINLDHNTIRGAIPFFNPTQARLRVGELAPRQPKPEDGEVPEGTQTLETRTKVYWRSRDNRKGQFYVSHGFFGRIDELNETNRKTCSRRRQFKLASCCCADSNL